MLTKKQYELLMFIEKRLRSTGISPSFDEMKDALALKSKSASTASSRGWRNEASFAGCPTAPVPWRSCASPRIRAWRSMAGRRERIHR